MAKKMIHPGSASQEIHNQFYNQSQSQQDDKKQLHITTRTVKEPYSNLIESIEGKFTTHIGIAHTHRTQNSNQIGLSNS